MARVLKQRWLCVRFSLFLLLLIYKVSAVTKKVQMTKLERKADFDDYTCLTQDLKFSTSVSDMSRCALMCVKEDACQTMFYNKQEGQCRGCTARYTPASMPLHSPGFKHFQKPQSLTSCAAGWTRFQGSCYTLSPTGPFLDGVTYCETNNAHPVYVETSEENAFLKDYLKQDAVNVYWFMGMTDSAQNLAWRYFGTNEQVSFLDFYPSEPDDSSANDQQCAIFAGAYGFNYQWADHYCFIPFPTICEKTL